ncbi:MAG TPA: GNAT family protein [Marmoricola sp.]|nr:GNAT family protein [Marmoricola sp.]
MAAPIPPTTRLVRPDDAAVLSALLRENRESMAPFEPVRPDDWFTEEGQARVVADLLRNHDGGTTVPHVVLDDTGAVAGRITLNNIVRGPFLSCSVGYWVDAARRGQGLATAAVAAVKRVAFDDLGLHRVEAGTLLHNVASQQVLRRNGFVPFGVARDYLHIGGRWQDHVLFQVLATDPL